VQPALIRYPIQQWAYVVNDVEAACAKWTEMTGAGPFYVSLHHEGTHTYRGEASKPDLSYAFGSVGDVHVQLIQQHCDTPSVYRELFAHGKEGFHHFALLVPDFAAERARFAASGCPVVTELVSAARVCYVDARSWLGAFVELYEDNAPLRKIFASWNEEHARWDGRTDPIRKL
jgi:hypothetical protein